MLTGRMLTVKLAGPAELTAWQDYVERTPGAGPLHHAAWYSILTEAFSVKPYFLYALDESGQVVGILPAYHSRSPIAGRHLTSLEGGILAQGDDVTAALLREALALRDRTGSRYLQLRGGAAEGAPTSVSTVHTLIETRQSVDQLWSGIKRKTRWGIRQTEKQDITIERDDALANLDAFYKVYAEHMRDLGTPVFGISTFRAMRKHLGNKRLRLYLAKHKSRLIGGMLCITHGTSWTDWYAVMRPQQEMEFANYALYWHAIRDASQLGVETFDLGRSTPNSNVHLFKRKWGGVDREVPYRFYPSPGARPVDMGLQDRKQSKGLSQRIWSHLPLSLCNALGPAIRRQLPFI